MILNYLDGTIQTTNTYTILNNLDTNIIPKDDLTYNLGSPDKKFNELFIGNNSIWFGDTHKISISNDKLKFKKIKNDTVPSGLITKLDGIINHFKIEEDIKTFANVTNLSDINLGQWLSYARQRNPSVKNINEIFTDADINDETQDETIWITNNTSIYNNTSYDKIGIGTTNPTHNLHIEGDTLINGNLLINDLNIMTHIENTSNNLVTLLSNNSTSIDTITTHVTANVAPNYYYIDQSPVTEYTVLDCDSYNLKIWYKFDGNADDSNPSTTKYNLTNNNVSFVPGIINQCASFDNNADLLTLSSFNLTDLLGQTFTFTFWVKVKSGIAQWGQLVHFDNNDALYFRRANANRLEFWMWNGSSRLFTLTSSDYTLDVWRHYTVTYNNTEAKLYLDGGLYQIVSTGNTINIGNGTMRIGDRNINDQSFRGEIDDFRIYNKALTATEIGYLANKMIKLEPQPIYENTTHQLQNLAEQKTGFKGWRLVRFLPPDAGMWYSVNDNALGTATAYGTAYDYTNEWSVAYGGTFDEMCFSTYSFSHWLYCTKATVQATYNNTPANIIRSSLNNEPYTVNWYNRGGSNPEDPWVSISDYSNTPNLILYGENNSIYNKDLLSGYGGMCVFVRTSTDTETINPEPEYKVLTFTYDEIRYPEIDADVTNLKAWYKFDDNGNDSSGNNKHLTSYGTISYSTNTVIGKSSLYGTNGYFQYDNTENYFNQNVFSVSVWFNFQSKIDYQSIASCRDADANSSGWTIYIYNNNLILQLGRGTGYGHWTMTPDILMTTNVWYHMVFTLSPLLQVNLYLNGVLQNTTTLTSYGLSDEPLRIGQGASETDPPVSSLQYESGGLIDDFRIYDKDLSQAEITDLYNQYSQTLYALTFDNPTECDILIVGGGGGGGKFGGGGGGGAVLFRNNIELNGTLTIKTGNGGIGADAMVVNGNGTNGYDSSILIDGVEYIAKGGGGGGTRPNVSPYSGRNGNDGGSGGGGSQSDSGQTYGGVSVKNTYTGWDSYGNSGGQGRLGAHAWTSGGGGGAGSVGSNATSSKGGDGGTGKGFITYFGAIVGHNGYFGGGGGGNLYKDTGTQGYGNGGNGLFGGGGDGAYDGNPDISAIDGLPNTGGGGGGGKHSGGTAEDENGGHGGSGIVIIRYKTTNTKNSVNISSLVVNQTIEQPIIDIMKNDDSVLFIDESGNVGINNNTPEKKLHIEGDTLIKGNLFVNDINIITHIENTSNNLTNIISNTNFLSNTISNDDIQYTNFKHIHQSPVTEYTILNCDKYNLKIWYKFDGELIGSRIKDYGLLQNHLDIYGSSNGFNTTDYVVYPSSYENNAIDNNYLKMYQNLDLYQYQSTTGLSISFWFKITQTASSTNQYGSFFWFHNTTNNNNLHVRIYNNTNDNFLISIDTYASSNYIRLTPDPPVNIWTHFILTIDNEGNWSVYINNINKSIIKQVNLSNSIFNDCKILSGNNDTNTIGAIMDDFRIYNKVLTVDEISLLYNRKLRIPINLPLINPKSYIEELTGMTDWIKIKHSPVTVGKISGNTFSGSTIDGTFTIGDENDNTTEWAIPFNSDYVKYFCFLSKDSDINSDFKDRWIVIERSEMIKEIQYQSSGGYGYNSLYPHYYKTTYKPNGFVAKTSTYYVGGRRDQIIYNRSGSSLPDPQIATYYVKKDGTPIDPNNYNLQILVHPYAHYLVYRENGSTELYGIEQSVYIKYTDDIQIPINIEPKSVYDTHYTLEYLAQQKTGVKGWRLVRFLPPTSTTWYSVNDNSFGTAPAYGIAYDYTNEWSLDYGGTFDEMFFSTKNMIYWLWTPKTSVEGEYSNVGRLVYKSSNNSSQHNVAWYNRSVYTVDPFISVLNHSVTVNQCLYSEDNGSGTSYHTQLIAGNEGMCVFVRNSTDVITVNPVPEPNYNTLIFGYDESLITYPTLDCDSYNLVAHFTFDDSGNLFNNLGKNEIEATGLSGNTTNDGDYTQDGKILGGLYKQSTGDITGYKLTPSNFLSQYFSNKISLTFWIKNEAHVAPHLFRQDGVLSIGMWENALRVLINDTSSTYLYYEVDDTDLSFLKLNEWVHVVITIDASSNSSYEDCIKVYRNGVNKTLKNPPISSSYTLGNNFLNSNNDFKILGRGNDGGGNGFKGYIDDLRFYDKALTQEEITDLYTQYSQTKYEINFSNPTKCDILIVGGGGAGGVDNGGGGGGGGVLYATDIELNGTYTIKVGDGGKKSIPINNPDGYNPTNSGNGYSSLFGSEDDMVEVLGGGYGGNAGDSGTLATNGGYGGSGGGGVYNNGKGGIKLQPIYNSFITSANSIYYSGNGGDGILLDSYIGGGGGGASGIIPTNHNGADGIQIDIDGNNYYWGGGGGGIYWENTAGSGGLGGGGGAGGLTSMEGLGGLGGITNGEDGTGAGSGGTPQGIGGNGGAGTGGGGGGDAYSSPNKGGNGGSGIVIIRYKETYENKNNLISIKNNNNKGITINNKDYIGINNDYPTNTFDINGNININNNENKTALIVTQNTNLPIVDIKKNNDSILFIDNLGNIGINNKLPQKNLHIEVDTLINDNDLIIMNGNIGIGTDNFSQHKLHVIGNTNIDGDLNVSGGLIISGGQTTIDTNQYTTEQLFITNDGLGPALLINQNGTGNILDIKEHNNNILFIKDGGNIGIGTIDPQYKLDIRSSSPIINLYGNNNNDVVGLRISSNNNNNTAPLLYLFAQGQDNSCQIVSRYNYPIKFYTNNTNAMIIDTNQNIGIGTTSPTTPLQVGIGITVSNADDKSSVCILSEQKPNEELIALSLVNYNITNPPTSFGSACSIAFHVNKDWSPTAKIMAINTDINIDSTTTYKQYTDLVFYTFYHEPLSESMRITCKGDVGIGIDTPVSKLDVDGNLNIRGDINFTGLINQNSIPIALSTEITAPAYNNNNKVSANIGIHNTDYAFLDLRTNNNLGGWIDFSSIVGEDFSTRIRGHNDPVKLEFYASSTPDMILNSNGDLNVKGNITAYYSDERLKTKIEDIDNVLDKIKNISVFKYKPNDIATKYGFSNKQEIGLSAQQISYFYPELVSLAPFDREYDNETKMDKSKSGENYLTLNYERLVPILIQGIKELTKENDFLKNEIINIKKIINNKN